MRSHQTRDTSVRRASLQIHVQQIHAKHNYNMCVCVWLCLWLCLCLCLCLCLWLWLCVCGCVAVSVAVAVCLCLCVCVCGCVAVAVAVAVCADAAHLAIAQCNYSRLKVWNRVRRHLKCLVSVITLERLRCTGSNNSVRAWWSYTETVYWLWDVCVHAWVSHELLSFRSS